jgi:paraquat-inducible protein A
MSALVTAQQAALQLCHACGRLSPLEGTRHCPRCLAALHPRKPDSLARTWALVITAAILYIPANVLPIMSVTSMGKEQSDTIMSGIIYFVKNGSWPLATLIFFASIVVPFLKLTILSFLMVSVQRRSHWNPVLRARMYRLTEIIGRWSMLDIFVVTIMVAMVAMGAFATVEPGPGAVAFALVVVATILASRSFDPRLIWDAMEPHHG